MNYTLKKLAAGVAGAVLTASLVGCGDDGQARNADLTPPPMGPEPATQMPVEATPSMEAQGDVAQQNAATLDVQVVSAEDTSQTLGTATLVQMEEGLTVRFNIAANDVIPGGERAIHIHQNASCDPADTNNDGTPEPAGGAGGHFNPASVPHGEDGPHAGDSEDLNYTFEDNGSFTAEVVFPEATLQGEHSVRLDGGTAIVIHAGQDDGETDPSGNAGPRIACAVIPALEQQGAMGMDDTMGQ